MKFESLKMSKGERTGLWVVVVILVLLSIVSISLNRCSTDVPEDAVQKAMILLEKRDTVLSESAAEEAVTINTEKQYRNAESPLKRELPEIKD